MTLSVLEIKTRVQRQFGDESGNQINANDIVRWINDSMREIAHKKDLFQVKATSAAVAQQAAYALPAGISKLYSVKYKGIALQALSMAEADELIGSVDLTVAQGYPVGTPSHYFMWANQINLYPAPDSAGNDITVYYTRVPTAVAADGDIPELPDEYHNRIVEYCLAQAHELDDNLDASQIKMAQFQRGVSDASDNSWTPEELYPFITSSDEDSYLDARY